MQKGNNLIASFNFGNQAYNLIVYFTSDGMGYSLYCIQLIKGDWTVAPIFAFPSASVVTQAVIQYKEGQTEIEHPDISAYVQAQIKLLNDDLLRAFPVGGIVTPVIATYIEKLEAAIMALTVALVNNVPQVK